MPDYVLAGARTVGVIATLLLAILLLCRVRPTAATGLAHRFAGRVIEPRFPHLAGRFVGTIDSFVSGLRGVSRPWHLAAAVFYSFLVWILMAAWYQMAMWMFGEHPSWWVGMVLNVMIAMAVAAPSAPGFIGTFQAGCVLGLAVIFPYTREFAVAYSLVTHLLQTVVVLVAGFTVLQSCGLRWAALRQPPAGVEVSKK